MSWVRKGINYLIFGNLFIAVVAVVMAETSYSIFYFPSNALLLLFVFFGTLCSYSLHWFLSGETLVGREREAWTLAHKQFLLGTFFLSAPACLYLFFQLDFRSQLYACGLGLATFLYTAPKIPFQPFVILRKIAIGKTVYLALVWTLTTIFLPLAEWEMEESPEVWLFFLNRLALILPICILFDSKDKESDLQQGLKNIVYSLTWKQTKVVVLFCLLVFFLSAWAFVWEDFEWRSFLQLAGPGLGLALLLPIHQQKPSDYYYYFWLDGLMMGTGLLHWLL